MRDDSVLERRVADLERDVADLRRMLASAAKPRDWLHDIMNDVRDAEAMKLLADLVEENADAERREAEASPVP